MHIFHLGLLLTDNYATLLICAVLIGLARGFRTIYWILVVPSYVPIERLASASGLQSVLNGLIIWMGAPFLGEQTYIFLSRFFTLVVDFRLS